MGMGSLLTGLAIYKPTQLHIITALLGSYERARWFHFWLTLSYVGFFAMHVAQVIRAGWNNFPRHDRLSDCAGRSGGTQ